MIYMSCNTFIKEISSKVELPFYTRWARCSNHLFLKKKNFFKFFFRLVFKPRIFKKNDKYYDMT